MKKNITNTFIILAILIILVSLIGMVLVYFNNYTNIFNNSSYIPTKKRETYIIKNVDDITIDDYISKKDNTLIIFWASWCQACTEESDILNNFINNNPNIPVIVVSFDKTMDDLENYLQHTNYKWFTIFDPSRKVRQKFDDDTKGIPATYLIDKNLNIISKKISSMTEEDFINFYNLNK